MAERAPYGFHPHKGWYALRLGNFKDEGTAVQFHRALSIGPRMRPMLIRNEDGESHTESGCRSIG